ncbi:MAG: pentapeptide repeat-containing protein [Candidatus Aenigmatarchaeota archaeon]
MKKEYLRASAILKVYKEGRRDFSGVVCNNDSFDNFDLRGIIFKKANLSYCGFHSTNLEGADLSGAVLEWTGFIRANLRHANFEKVRAVWSRFNEAQFEKTNMRGADVSWSLFFDTNLFGGADLTGAIGVDTIATDPSQITEEGMKKLAEQLGKMQGKIDQELAIRLELITKSTKEKSAQTKAGENVKDVYEGGGNAGYSGGKGGYSSKGQTGTAYGSADVYSAKRKRKHDAYE